MAGSILALMTFLSVVLFICYELVCFSAVVLDAAAAQADVLGLG
jgi:hypothetical protein